MVFFLVIRIGKKVEASTLGLIQGKVSLGISFEELGENNKGSMSGYLVFRTRFEPSTSRVQTRCLIARYSLLGIPLQQAKQSVPRSIQFLDVRVRHMKKHGNHGQSDGSKLCLDHWDDNT
jgi:hypothetical protein